MEGHLKTSLVRIRVPTNTGRYIVGSGYPVARDLVMTARHVVRLQAPLIRAANKPILVTWVYLKNADNKNKTEYQLNEESIVWESETFDVCLLRCEVPGEAMPRRPSAQQPRHHAVWGSEGFARVGRNGSQRQPVSLGGKTYSQEASAARFDLDIEGKTNLKDGWKGASGSPVFVGDQLIGVITDCPENFGQGRFKAAATFRLYENTSFAELLALALAPGERSAYRDELQQGIKDDLERAPEALTALAKAAGQSEPITAARLAEHLLSESNIGRTISAFRRAHDVLAKNPAWVESRKKLLGIIERTIPAIIMPETVEMIRRLRHNPQEAVIVLPAFQLTVAEFLMAGADRRPCTFAQESRRKPADWPRGSFLLSDKIECGPELGAEAYEQAVRKILEAEYADSHELFMLRNQPADRAEAVRRNISRMAETPYFFCDPTAHGREEGYAILKRDFQYIVFMQLDPPADERKQEDNLFHDLLDLLAPVTKDKT